MPADQIGLKVEGIVYCSMDREETLGRYLALEPALEIVQDRNLNQDTK